MFSANQVTVENLNIQVNHVNFIGITPWTSVWIRLCETTSCRDTRVALTGSAPASFKVTSTSALVAGAVAAIACS